MKTHLQLKSERVTHLYERQTGSDCLAVFFFLPFVLCKFCLALAVMSFVRVSSRQSVGGGGGAAVAVAVVLHARAVLRGVHEQY